MHVGLDNIGHNEGGLLQTLPVPCDSDHHLLGSHLRLLDHDPGLGVVCYPRDDLASHPRHVLQHTPGDLHVLGGDVSATLDEDLVIVPLTPGTWLLSKVRNDKFFRPPLSKR